MSKINDGGPAFPTTWDAGYNAHLQTDDGMTLRDYFAAHALAGLATNCGFQGGPWDKLAKDAYAAADAMLDARITSTE